MQLRKEVAAILTHIVVCLKQVPDVSDMRMDPKTHTVVRSGAATIVNPDDQYALELALECKDRWGAKVTAVTMGPDGAERAVRYALRQGADAGVHLCDRAFSGADTLVTSLVLARVVHKLAGAAPVDVVVCGDKAVDGDTAQVGPGLAARLNCALVRQVTGVQAIEADQSALLVERKTRDRYQRVLVPLPCLLTVVPGRLEVRYAALPHLVRAARAKVPRLSAQDLGFSPQQVGLAGSATRVRKVSTVSFPTRVGQEVDSTEQGLREAAITLQTWASGSGQKEAGADGRS